MNEAFLCACFVPCYYWWLKYEDAILACKYFLQKAGSCEIYMKLSFYNALKMSVFLYFKGIFFCYFCHMWVFHVCRLMHMAKTNSIIDIIYIFLNILIKKVLYMYIELGCRNVIPNPKLLSESPSFGLSLWPQGNYLVSVLIFPSDKWKLIFFIVGLFYRKINLNHF